MENNVIYVTIKKKKFNYSVVASYINPLFAEKMLEILFDFGIKKWFYSIIYIFFLYNKN